MSVNSYLRNIARNLYISRSGDEYDSIERSVAVIKRRLNSHFSDRMQNGIQFGSSTRGTMLPRATDSHSDVDYMVIFKNENGYKPQTLMMWLRRFAEKYYSQSEIRRSHPTVVLELNHIMFDLVPAYRNMFWQLQIPAPPSNFEEWTRTSPKSFNDELVEVNKENDYKIKPTIRLVKYWNAQNDHVYESYKLEKNVCRAFYIFKNSKWDYFKKAMESLSASELPKYKRRRVESAQRRIKEITSELDSGNSFKAKSKLQRLLPKL